MYSPYSVFGAVSTKADIIKLQKAVQLIATRTKRKDLAFTLTPKYTDGIVGPGTTRGVNLSLGTNLSLAYVKGNIISLTARLLKVAQAAAVQKQTTEQKTTQVLTQTKVSSGVIPITSDSYLKVTKGGYLIYKKPAGKNPIKIGNVLVTPGKLKITAPGVSLSTGLEIRRRVPSPQNTFAATLNGKTIASRLLTGPVDQPPPVSPFVPSKAPSGSLATDYVTKKTPSFIQKIVSKKQPPPKGFAPKTLPPNPKSLPTITVTQPPKILPYVPESEATLERFFAQTAMAGRYQQFFDPSMGAAYRVMAARRARARLRGEFVYDTRNRYVSPIHWQANPTRTEIVNGHDDMDDADEELAEMQESGFSKGFWPRGF